MFDKSKIIHQPKYVAIFKKDYNKLRQLKEMFHFHNINATIKQALKSISYDSLDYSEQYNDKTHLITLDAETYKLLFTFKINHNLKSIASIIHVILNKWDQ